MYTFEDIYFSTYLFLYLIFINPAVFNYSFIIVMLDEAMNMKLSKAK